jgi:3-oxoacyl-[acyl-carrier protein] reductase
VQRGGGAIVNVGSTVIVRGSPRAQSPCAPVRGRQVRPAGREAVLRPGSDRARRHVASGLVETEALLNRPEWHAGRREVVLSGTPGGKIPKPEEMTGAALFLASEDAHHITGSYMIADGGYSMLGA